MDGQVRSERDPRSCVALIFGGPSAEHEVSIESARHLFPHLLEAGFLVVPVHWSKEGGWGIGRVCDPARTDAAAARANFEASLRAHRVPVGQAAAALEHRVDVLFPALHGAFGEDGSLQGFARVLGLPVVGSPLLAQAVGMDKERTKQLLAGAGAKVRTPRGLAMEARGSPEDRRRFADELRVAVPLPWIVKPVDAGSSVGLTVVEEPSRLGEAIDAALAVDGARGVLVEERIDGRELTAAILEERTGELVALPLVEIRPVASKLFDYHAKYTRGAAQEICPAPVDAALTAQVQAAAIETFRTVGARGYARVDFLVGPEGPCVLEINTLPGMTEGSLYPLALRTAGRSMAGFLRDQIDRVLPVERSRARAGGAS